MHYFHEPEKSLPLALLYLLGPLDAEPNAGLSGSDQ